MAFGGSKHSIAFFRNLIGACILLAILSGQFMLPAGAESVEPAELAEESAEAITAGCTVSVTGNTAGLPALLDNSLSTVWKISDDSTITIDSPSGIGSIYIEWGVLPASWSATFFGRFQYDQGTTRTAAGFLNEYIPTEKTARQVRISVITGGKTASVARLTVFSRGSPPDKVQQWSPPLAKADMLVLPTHADDELIYFGGTLPTYAGEQKKKVQVAYLTSHDTPRTRELLAGLWITGVVNYPAISSFPDQYAGSFEEAARIYPEAEVLGYQVMLLRRFKPEVVIGHDLDGEYGHGMHIMNARLLTQALALSGDPSKYPESAELHGTWTVKKCYLHLYDENMVVMDWLPPLAAFDGLSAWDVAKLAYAEHVSQHVFKFRVRIEGPNDCRLFGLYSTTVGPDSGKNDFFENIPLEPAATATPSPEVTAALSSSSGISSAGGSGASDAVSDGSSLPEGSSGTDSEGSSAFSWFGKMIIGNPKTITIVIYLLFVSVLIVLIRLIYAKVFTNKR